MQESLYLLGERSAVLQQPAPATLACQRRIWWVAERLREAGHTDVVPGMNNLTLIFDPDRLDACEVLAQLKRLWRAAGRAIPTPRQVVIPVCYGGESGPDLGQVARYTGLNEAQVVATHSRTDYTVFFLGFQPGFAYLGGLPATLATPRLTMPRLCVPAGSIGIGGEQTGIYPAASPGGWQLIGRTEVSLFDPEQASPSLLLPGDTVRFAPTGGPYA
ncbi:5-oxoprolinase subunit PxpB [Aeromonas hydrophila]|uniref:5-oxoprolinase subunit PxpB n=1 Tax=Aeromonas hydrophila TaxID=644 RepID=UPI0022AE55CE|nr:5-oxoprolinase subunit PxpB [Aeromonas hydrophila]MCZ4335684.1 5-oxoprolinase subunit PxpB [Aeromonas hydrophila]